MNLLYIKALHIVGFVTWFAGLFYWLRIFVYLAESHEREVPAREILFEQFTKMERRVYSIILVPGMTLTWLGGLGMIAINPAYLSQGWLHIKLLLLIGLVIFQFWAKSYIRKIEANPIIINTERLRLLNEVPTVFLVAIVLLAVLRNGLDAGIAFVILVSFIAFLMVGVRYYKGFRARNPDH